jgi:hypothetical protein
MSFLFNTHFFLCHVNQYKYELQMRLRSFALRGYSKPRRETDFLVLPERLTDALLDRDRDRDRERERDLERSLPDIFLCLLYVCMLARRPPTCLTQVPCLLDLRDPRWHLLRLFDMYVAMPPGVSSSLSSISICLVEGLPEWRP